MMKARVIIKSNVIDIAQFFNDFHSSKTERIRTHIKEQYAGKYRDKRGKK